MSILADFGAGFFGSLYEQRKEAQRLKDEIAQRAAEMAQALEDSRTLRDEGLAIEDERRREGEGFNPETGLVEWIRADGTTGSRPATAAEQAQHRAALAAAERQGILDAARVDRDLAAAQASRARAANAGRSTREEGIDYPKPVDPATAATMLGLPTDTAINTESVNPVDRELFRLLITGKLRPQEIDDMRIVVQKRLAGKRGDNAALIDSVGNLLD